MESDLKRDPFGFCLAVPSRLCVKSPPRRGRAEFDAKAPRRKEDAEEKEGDLKGDPSSALRAPSPRWEPRRRTEGSSCAAQ